MNRDELEKRNVGENLDSLMNLDPRGYGVCRILYAGSRKVTGEPLTMHAEARRHGQARRFGLYPDRIRSSSSQSAGDGRHGFLHAVRPCARACL